ncbi:hypothetical protein Tco_0802664 [Tanacetum coccineum]|uniref:Gag protein n=1 Tax=Tanacetum coccineum TaxID=301880 RepID=A0ABQ5A1Y8_9ASTR
MHNNIMAAGSRDHPTMLATGRYAQWQSRFLRYINTRPNAHEMWIAIERLQQGESLNIQDVKTNLFWEFGYFTSQNGESMESYYSRFYKMMNEMIRNNLTVAMMQINLFDVLKQYQKEVNKIRAERIAKNANPLALVVAAQPHPDPYYQAPKSHKSYAPTSKASPPTRSHATTIHKGKEQPNQSHLYMSQLLKKTTGQFGNQRTVTIAGARETVASQVVQQTGIQCFNYKEFGHFAKECRKPKRVKDFTYHKEKMLLFMAKIQEVPTADSGTDTEPLEQVQYNAGYNVFANERQHSEQPESVSNTCVVEKVDSNVIPDSPDMCDNDIQTNQNAVECDDERVSLANLIANLKLDVGENKKIQKQLKKANTSLDHELKECKSILAKTSITLGESNSILDSCLIALTRP